jgi:hypothetical protein
MTTLRSADLKQHSDLIPSDPEPTDPSLINKFVFQILLFHHLPADFAQI